MKLGFSIATTRLATVTLLGGVCVSCATLVSDDQELALGQQYGQELAQKSEVDRDPYAVQYLNGMGQLLVQASPSPPRIPIQFHLIQDESLNAFAIPGGSIYVHSGSIKAAQTENQLAAVMAHEIGHVVKLHHKESMGREMGVDTVSGLVFGQQEGLGKTVGSLVSSGVMQKFSRDQEYEADTVAVQILSRAGYNPQGIVDFFGAIQATSAGQPSKVESWFSSHPMTANRIAQAQALIQQYPAAPGAMVDRQAYQQFRASIR